MLSTIRAAATSSTAIGSRALADRKVESDQREPRELEVEISAPLTTELRRVAKLSGAPPTAIVFAAFCALVYRYSEESLCSIGVDASPDRGVNSSQGRGVYSNTGSGVNSSAGRGVESSTGNEVESSAGGAANSSAVFNVAVPLVTTNMHLLQIDLANDPPFEELLKESYATLCGALGHSPDGSGSTPYALGFGSLDNTSRHRALADIWTVVIDDGRRLTLRWTYDGEGVERSMIERVAAHFTHLLEGLFAEPGRPISRVPLMDDAERRSVLNLARGKEIPYERNTTIHALFSLQARATPNAIAVVADRGTLSYGELEQRANQLGHYLRSLGVGAGTAVGVFLDRSLALPVVLLAILKAGGLYVPLDANYPRERLEFIVHDAGIGLIVTESASSPSFEGVSAINLNTDAAMIALHPTELPPASASADALAYISYTSGSTGRPKGVAVMHRGVIRLVRGTDYIAVRGDDVFLQCAPVAFDASTFELWAPLLNGAELAIPRPGLLSMPELGDTIDKFGVTVLFLTTSLFQKFVESLLRVGGTLRLLLTGGEVASPRHMLQFLEERPDCELMAVYGPTENTTFSTWCALANAAAIGHNVPIGRPIGNSSAYVLDRHGEPVPIGVIGELWVGGDGVAQGYVNSPELTHERFVRDPFSTEPSARLYRTGDRARLRSDGILEFLGRNDDQVKIRGHRVELGEIEAVLQANPGVLDAAVVATQDSSEKALVAFVLRTAGADADERGLRAFLTTKLPTYMLPHRFEFVDRLPQHPSGKLDRMALAREASAPTLRAPSAQAAPASTRSHAARSASAMQDAITAIWREVLGSGRTPGVDENFFDAGGDSLRLLTVHERLQREFSIKLRVVDLFEHTTVRKIASLIGRSQVRV